MSLALVEPATSPVTERLRPALTLVPGTDPSSITAPTRPRPRRSGPGVGPVARPRRLRFTAPPQSRPAACRVPVAMAVAVAEPAPRTGHLTERGLALVLVVAAALVAASVVVVALTAVRVTGESYQPGHSVAAPVVAQH